MEFYRQTTGAVSFGRVFDRNTAEATRIRTSSPINVATQVQTAVGG